MAVLRFDPFRDLDRLTEQMLGVPLGNGHSRFMPMDLYRSGDHYVLHADLPGIDPGSIAVTVEGGTLTIKAERTGRVAESAEWLAGERFTGTYMRQVSLSSDMDPNRIEATYENGVLTVTMPVEQKAKPTRIEIKASSHVSGTTTPAVTAT